jgi:hypothetical protein
LRVERTTTEPVIEYDGDINLAYMPFSHSIVTMVAVGVITLIVCVMAGRARLGLQLDWGRLAPRA